MLMAMYSLAHAKWGWGMCAGGICALRTVNLVSDFPVADHYSAILRDHSEPAMTALGALSPLLAGRPEQRPAPDTRTPCIRNSRQPCEVFNLRQSETALAGRPTHSAAA
ncbi:hypothetical protein BO71DRAFT_113494 [Aspergillus ellipticus CBS 707.79]|uniref:Uncharacterized protein n=1 Tax=Aspergillus ellipticus CBS 707.79 TaxID=1448320 RepID=A0A319CX07_9EURO|nr:hypothetical protein BO71DRAFT_113494 [Aspergillus ellipticus CBS 707.79]